MQSHDNLTPSVAVDVNEYPWTTYLGTERSTTDTHDTHRPQLTCVDTDSADEEEVDPNNFYDVDGVPSSQTTEMISDNTSVATTTEWVQETGSVPDGSNPDRISRPIPSRFAHDISKLLHSGPSIPSGTPNGTRQEQPECHNGSDSGNGLNIVMADINLQQTIDTSLSYQGLTTYSKI